MSAKRRSSKCQSGSCTYAVTIVLQVTGLGKSHAYLLEPKCGQAQKQYLRILCCHWFTYVIPWVGDRAGVRLLSFTAFACLVDAFVFIMELGTHAG